MIDLVTFDSPGPQPASISQQAALNLKALEKCHMAAAPQLCAGILSSLDKTGPLREIGDAENARFVIERLQKGTHGRR